MRNSVHNSSAQVTDITSKSRDEFVNFLDSEISSLRSEIQRPGWTTWAILGGIAALVWLLFSEIEIGKYSSKNVAGSIFVIWLFYSFYINIKTFINPPKPHKSTERFFSGSITGAGRLSMILLVGIQIFLLFIISRFSSDVGILATIAAYYVIVIWILASLLILIITFTNIPIPLNMAYNTPSKIGDALSSILTAIALWFYVKFLFISPGTANIFDIRLAMVISAISCLVFLLMFKSAGSLTLESLTVIKREFFLGRLDLDTAKRQVDIALTGLDASQAFEEYLSKLLPLLRDASLEFDKCTEHLGKLERLYSEMKGSPTEEQMLEFKSKADSINESLDKVTMIIAKSVPAVFKPLQRRIYIVSVLARNPDIFKEIRLKVNDAISQINQQHEDFSKRLDLLIGTIEERRRTVKSGQPDGQNA